MQFLEPTVRISLEELPNFEGEVRLWADHPRHIISVRSGQAIARPKPIGPVADN